MRALKHLLGYNLASGFPLVFCLCGCLIFLATFSLLPSNTGKILDEAQENDYSRRRTEMCESMAADFEKHGAKFLAGGTTSQSLNLSEIFTFKKGKLQAILKPAMPPVRAAVLYLEPHYAEPISVIVKSVLSPYFPRGVWFQDRRLYHFSMFHASHHLDPVLATPFEIDAEVRQVENVARRCCPLSIALEKVVLTSTGVLLGCWQVLNGTEPAMIRRELQKSLPRSPARQLYNKAMLHTSFARLLGPPKAARKGSVDGTNNSISLFQQLVSDLNKQLKNYKAVVKELWYVEEQDVLALALKGHMKSHRFSLQCLKV